MAGRRTLLHTLFVSDAFSSREHQQFALRGCIAATLRDLIYNGVDWPGISTSLATCIIIVLGTIGASRQKQARRIRAPSSAASASPCLRRCSCSAHGLHQRLHPVFCRGDGDRGMGGDVESTAILCRAGDRARLRSGEPAGVDPSDLLDVARDRVVGVLLGLAAMWLVFDQFGGRRAGESMIAMLADLLGVLAELNAAYGSFRRYGDRASVACLERIRARINAGFTQMNGQADGVIFEFGPLRAKHLRERDRTRTVQPAMRSTFPS